MSIIFSERYAVTDPAHFQSAFFSGETLERIRNESVRRLAALGVPYRPSEDSVRGVMDSVFHSSPRIGLPELATMCVDYIVSYLRNEHEITEQNRSIDISVLKYDGSFGIQQLSQGQIKSKKGPNRFQFRMIY
jgi:hypothetical protein